MMWKATVLAGSLALALPSSAMAEKIAPPAVPGKLAAPAGYRPYELVHAEGTQNYICLPAGEGFTWTFLGPQATLFGHNGEQVMTHFLSPNPAEAGTPRATWQHSRDSSTVWAIAIQSSTDADYVQPGAIPWLLLRIVGWQYGPGWGDRLAKAGYIQRVNTAGGVAPAEGCSAPGDLGKRALVPYTTDYVFYR